MINRASDSAVVWTAGIALLMSGGSVCSIHALGIRVADQDPFATARGNAFVATADNPSAIYYNPAGLTLGDGFDFRAGFYGVGYQSEYSGPTRAFQSEDEFSVVPQAYAAHAGRLEALGGRRYAVGLGFYAPYGLRMEWPENSSFRSLALEGEIRYWTINPVVAIEVVPGLSVGAGPSFNFADAFLRQGAPQVAPGADFRFSGDDMDVGFNAGVLWRPHVKHSFGLSYRSATRQTFEGRSEIRNPDVAAFDAKARFDFPQVIVAGYSFRPTERWNLEFNVDWTDWNTLDRVDLRQTGGPDVPLDFHWRSSFFYEWGVTRYFEGGWRVSGGYIFSENSVPERSFNPVVPDSDRHIFSLGAGREYEHWRWDAAYQYAHGPKRQVRNSPRSMSGESADGAYQFDSHAFTFAIGYHY